MLYISYQGIYDGQNYEYANTPDQIGKSFNNGFACMVDVWRIDNTLCVGPEAAPIPVTDKYLQGNRFWIKCGNQETYDWFLTQSLRQYPNYFYQPNSMDNVLTSSNRLWTPGTVAVNDTSIIVLPEIQDRGLFSTVHLRCYGVCSTFLTFIKRMRNEGEWY
jgi:hypothetical protein|tara:strand:+ start:116 stop:598 length:483 start_codon:yes stop_codon:yes gene_type:complete